MANPFEQPFLQPETSLPKPPERPTEGTAEKREDLPMMLQKAYSLMRENHIYAANAIVRSKFVELADGEPSVETGLNTVEEEFLNSVKNHAYWIFEGAHPEEKSVLVKMKVPIPDERNSGNCEEEFYENLRDDLMSSLPESIQGKISVPNTIKTGSSEDGKFTYVVIEYIEGDQLGEIIDIAEPLSQEEFQDLAEFIRFAQEHLTPERVAELAPNMAQSPIGDVAKFESHDRFLKKNAVRLEGLLGDLYPKLLKLHEDSEEVFANAQEVMSNHDINPANVIRRKDGNLCVIDWERMRKIPNKAAAISFIIEAHWRFPEQQRQMIAHVLESYSGDEEFYELLRVTMAIHQYTRLGISLYDIKAKNENNPYIVRANAARGVERNLELLAELLDEEGVWKEYGPQR